jgi:hypothetical protein
LSGATSKSSEENEEASDPFSALYDLGLIIFQDDAHDLAKGPFHTPEEIAKGDAPIHHWIVGLSIMAGSLLGKIFYALESAKLAQEDLSST